LIAGNTLVICYLDGCYRAPVRTVCFWPVLPFTALAHATAVQRTTGIQYQVAVRSARVGGVISRQGWLLPTVATGGSTLGEATVDDAVPYISERQVVSSPARPFPCSAQSQEARRTGASYHLGVQEFTLSADQPVDRPITRMDAGLCARNLPSTWEST